MTLPSGAGQSFDVILELLVKGDQAARATIDSIVESEKKLSSETKEQANFRRTQRIRESEAKIEASKIATAQLIQDIKEQEKAEQEAARAREQRRKDDLRGSQIQIREIRARAREITATTRIIKDTAGDIDRFAKPLASLGTLVVGGIFAATSKYVRDAKESTEVTREWKKAQDELNVAGARIGAVLAKEALPILKEAVVIVEKLAKFLEKNPGVVDFALKAGLLSVAVGTIGKAISSGLRLYADIKLDAALSLQLTAAQLQVKASENQLAAAGIQSKVSGGGAAVKGGGGFLAKAGLLTETGGATLLGAVASVIAGLLAGIKVNDILASMGSQNNAASNKWAVVIAYEIAHNVFEPLGRVFGDGEKDLARKTNNLVRIIAKLTGIDDARYTSGSSSASTAPSFLGGSEENQNKLLQAYEKYKADDLALVKKHYADRQNIVDEALRATQAENARYSAATSSISSAAHNATLKADQEYHKSDLQAEQEYLKQRSDLAAEGGKDIIRLEEDSQERLKKLRQDFEDRADEATRRRDALGLAAANKDYNRARAEEIAGTTKEIARRRADIALRLRELDIQFKAESERRLQDYQDRVKEIAAQRAEQLKEASAAHSETIRQIRQQEQDKLREENAAYLNERKLKREALIEQIRDTDSALLGESQLRRQHNAAMLEDLNKFLSSYRAGLASLSSGPFAGASSGSGSSGSGSGSSSTSTAGTSSGVDGWNSWVNKILGRDTGGYVGKGLYRNVNGIPEFVLSGDSTKAMEKIVGGQLNQNNIMQAAMRGGGQSVVWNDYRRFEGEVTAAMRLATQRDTEQTLRKVLRG